MTKAQDSSTEEHVKVIIMKFYFHDENIVLRVPRKIDEVILENLPVSSSKTQSKLKKEA